MKETEGVTEQLKENNQWEWLYGVNNIHQRVEELIIDKINV